MMSLIKSDNKKAIFQIENYRVINGDLLAEIRRQYKPEQIIFIPKKYDFDDLEIIKDKISKEYFVQLGFVCDPQNIISTPQKDTIRFGIKDISQTELVKMTLQTVKDYFDCVWRDYLGDKLSDANFEILKKVTKTKDSIVVFDFDKDIPVGMLITFPAHYCLGEPLQQIGWIWVDSKIDQDDRKVVHSIMTNWLKSQTYPKYQAGVHLFHARSQKFFHKLGFKVLCAHFIQR